MRTDHRTGHRPIPRPTSLRPTTRKPPRGGLPTPYALARDCFLPSAAPPAGRGARELRVPAGRVGLTARLTLPAAAPALVILVRGDGSSRHSPHDRYVAAVLERAGLGTALLDLLDEEEACDRHLCLDVPLLARRLRAAADWLGARTGLPVGCFGTGTGASAALEAAAEGGIRAVVSHAGRPDLTSPAALARLRVPALFVTGTRDTGLLGRTRLAADWMCCTHRVAVVPGRTDRFTEPDLPATVAGLARAWFTDRLTAARTEPLPPGAG
ncbi:alpha/beta hydrolase [Streptomyces echinoruber]|uniref:Hydrolase n=1 Tax=Streptomyces echinoruber TaxID=68898 RepID=A0A918RG40_9ACTN|nr:alpha/beta hydrolase [Streptomyces echinoruber]GGZ96000.1 hypothetical protein GCM10010389_39050 [Streptomyces echinoruber]